MGFFDDLVGLTKDIQGLRADVSSTVNQVVKEAVNLKGEATSAVTQLKTEAGSSLNQINDDVKAVKRHVISDFKPNIDNRPDSTK